MAIVGGRSRSALADALHAAGATITGTGRTVEADAGIVFYDSVANAIAQAPETRASLQRLLSRGGSVVFVMTGDEGAPNAYEDVMPLTPWVTQWARWLRPGTGATAPADSPLARALQTPGFFLPARFDLHLPYSTMETGQHRYEWERLGKSLLNTGWKVLLNTDQDGRLPLLVEGSYGPGRVFVFGGDLGDPALAKWAGYGAFLRDFLAYAKPRPVPDGIALEGLSLAIPPGQPTGDLGVDVTNASTSTAQVILLAKVRNLTHGLMNSVALPVTIPAGKTIRVAIPESDPLRAVAAAPLAADAAPFRWVEAGLASPARQAVVARQVGLVDRTPAVTLDVVGEDARRFPNADSWPAGGADFLQGTGFPLDRYVYFCGDAPKATVRLSNGFHDIAPLAAASDLGWPENPTVQGLNDGCYSYQDIRAKLPVYGYWQGKSAAEQHLRLDWPMPVTLARQGLSVQTEYRRWDQSNPPRYVFGTSAAKGLVTADPAAYDLGRRHDDFPAQAATSCTLDITGLDASQNREPRSGGLGAAGATGNCAIGEWEVYGWPSATPPPAVHGKWKVTVRDLAAGTETVVCDKDVALSPVSETDLPVNVPTRAKFGQVVVHAEFTPDGGVPASYDLPFLFVPKDAPHLISRDELGEAQAGFLCTPGFVALDDFGLGTGNDTQGWGGPDDQPWAWSRDLMEEGPRSKVTAQRMFLSPAGINHYSDPWREFPSGRYVWDWATDRMLDKFANGQWKGKKSIHIVLSDRWNGINIWGAFAWNDFMRFDEYLRARGRPGLQGRTRTEISDEIRTKYADQFQRFEMEKYADKLLESQKRFADAGIRLTVESHGSFPLVGGELGAKLAKTHNAVGTDVFWAILNEDPYATIGQRFGLVAANPDFDSGAYGQWGWVSGALANATWFSPSGDAEPSRRQWYTTYWMGRVGTDGAYKPLAVYGFSLQGGWSVKNTLADWTEFNRVQDTMIRVRPDKPTGWGVVASWQLQENRMGPASDTFGFGLYAAKGYDQVDVAFGDVFTRLAKNGAPLSFVTSTHALKKWGGTQPLVVVDGFETDPWELAELDRLNKGGAPVFAVGSESRAGREKAEALFGVRKAGAGWEAQAGTETVPDGDGKPLAYVRRRPGCAPLLFCPVRGADLTGPQSALLAAACLKLAGDPVQVPPGISVSPFLSQGSLFLPLGNQRDASLPIDVAVQPALLDPSLKGKTLRVVDLDRGVALPAKDDGGVLRFQVPCAPNDGRMIQIVAAP